MASNKQKPNNTNKCLSTSPERNTKMSAAYNSSTRSKAHSAHKAPVLPFPRMPLSQRAKIFIPFDPLQGHRDALREAEKQVEAAHYERGGLEEPS